MNLNYLVGIFAGINTTISFLPQVIKIYKNKSTGDISSIMYFVYTTGAVSWILYGTLVNDLIIIIFNSISVILICFIYFGIYLYNNKPQLENEMIENNNNVI